MDAKDAKEVQLKLMKGMLDLIVLQYLDCQPMHGYEFISRIRKTFGVYFGPSTIYPILHTLEKKEYVESKWDHSNERPRKVYNITHEGQTFLNYTCDSLDFIFRKMGIQPINRRKKETETQERVITPEEQEIKNKN